MTKSDLIARLAAHYRHLTISDVAAVVSVILSAMADRLADGNDGRVEIRGFGAFAANYRPPRIGRNPKTGARVPVAAKYVPHFKPGRILRDRVIASANSETPAAGEGKRTRPTEELTPVD